MALRVSMMTALVALALAGPTEPTAHACVWDYETYHAEAESLPCVLDAILGFWPKHTDRYHEVRLEATEHALRWVPGWAEGLDAKGVSLMKLGRMEQAEAVMKQRHALDPDAYPGHANLGTLYTFTGDYEPALTHIDRAMAIEPKAHFGREKYHRALVAFLQRVKADPSVAKSENFLGVTLTDEQRLGGSKEVFDGLGLDEDAFDALVSMITVYGAEEVGELYLTLGELLAARGHRRLAYSAYARAKGLLHPRRRELDRWMQALDDAIFEQFKKDAKAGKIESANDPEDLARGDNYEGIKSLYSGRRRRARGFRKDYEKWEQQQLKKGLPIWTREGLDQIYAHMQRVSNRCASPGLIEDDMAPPIGGEGSEPGEALENEATP